MGSPVSYTHLHSQHLATSDAVYQAVLKASDPDYDPESAALYGCLLYTSVFGFQHITAPGAMQARGLHFFGLKKFLDKKIGRAHV